MGILKALLGGDVTDLVDKSMKGLDELVTSDEERLKARTELTKQYQELASALSNEVIKEEEEVTKRLQSDNMSDTWLAKTVRPVVLLLLFCAVVGFGIADSISSTFNVPEAFIQVLGYAFTTAIGFYFGSRALTKREKILSLSKGMYSGTDMVDKVKDGIKLFRR